MSPSTQDSSQNIWFGISMFLIGLIAGVSLAIASGNGLFVRGATQQAGDGTPTAPTDQAPVAAARDRMIAYAADLNLDANSFATCIDGTSFNQKIADEQTAGEKAGVNGTPGNFIYSLKTKNAVSISGARPTASFTEVIDAMLKDPNYKSTSADSPNVNNLAPIDLANEHIRGNPDAQIAIVEYTDYQCPFCHRVHPTYQELMQKYGDKVMWVSRHFPLTSIHPDAMPLAIGAECANQIGGADAFWGFTDKVMAEQ